MVEDCNTPLSYSKSVYNMGLNAANENHAVVILSFSDKLLFSFIFISVVSYTCLLTYRKPLFERLQHVNTNFFANILSYCQH